MSRGLLEYKYVWSPQGDYYWRFRPIVIINEGKNSWRIWSWREPFSRVVHKKADHEVVVPR